MNIKHLEPIISSRDPFANCALDRKKYADVLSEIVKANHQGFVMAINNQWGTGKTTFVKMWNQQLINDGFQTLYFNAWENDFEADPLTAILAELKKIVSDDSDTYKSLLAKGSIFLKHIIPSVAKGIAKKYVDIDEVIEGIEGAVTAGAELLNDEIKKYSERKKGLIEFRSELEKVIKESGRILPLVFIIDELDRCRPDYAVELLEKIKHFFSVAGIVFIFSVDKVQLGNAIRGFYGSDQIDANEYLRRFIDIEYSIPEPNTSEFCHYLYEYYEFDNFFQSPARSNISVFRNDGYSFVEFAIILFSSNSLTLRQQEKIFAHARLAVSSFATNHHVFPRVFLLLIYLFYHHKNLYLQIRDRKLTLQQLTDKIEEMFPTNIIDDISRVVISTESILLYTYHNYYRELHHKNKIFEKIQGTSNYNLFFQSSLNTENVNNLFLSFILDLDRDISNVKLDFLLNKIELLDKVNF